jgi:uncharacterized membrane protein
MQSYRVSESLNTLPRLLPLLFLVWAFPLLITVAWLTPPWQNPDETAHLVRADQVAHGAILGVRRGGDAGGYSDPGIILSGNALASLAFHSEVKLRSAMLDQAAAFQWGRRDFIRNPNTAQYPPFLYLPQATAVAIGRAAHLSIVTTLRLARLAAALVASLVCAAAFAYARRTAPLLMVLAMLPMNIGLFASASQDGLMLACALLAVALLDRVVSESRDASKGETAMIVVLLALVVMARPPYLPLALLALLISRKLDRRAVAATASVLAAGLCWDAVILSLVTVSMHSAHPGAQLRLLALHPKSMVGIVTATWQASAEELRIETIGKLGWLDTQMVFWYYKLAEILLAIGFVGTLGGCSRRSWVVCLSVIWAFAAVVLAEYLAWSGVGAGRIIGLQGRYFEVVLVAAALMLPGIPGLARFTRPVAFGAAALMAAITPFVILKAIVWRYYLS